MKKRQYFFDGLHIDACKCVWQSTGGLLFSLVSSNQVARLACVLIASLAKLSSSFCKWSVLAPCRWLMVSLARWSHQWLSFGFQSPLWYLNLSWFITRNEVMLQLTIIIVLNHIYRVCCTWPHQVLDRTFCYQSHTVLNCIRFWIKPLLLEYCKKFSSPLAYASEQFHLTYSMTVKPAYLSWDTAWVCLW
jgi:hypothetical protein